VPAEADSMSASRIRMSRQDAEMIAISALGHLAGEDGLLDRFCALTGVGPTTLRDAAADSDFLGAVLDFYLADEPLLLAFAAARGLDPADIAIARTRLDPDARG
jgi:hypothetical protein